MKTIINALISVVLVTLVIMMTVFVITTETGRREVSYAGSLESKFVTVTFQPTNMFGMDIGEEYEIIMPWETYLSH